MGAMKMMKKMKGGEDSESEESEESWESKGESESEESDESESESSESESESESESADSSEEASGDEKYAKFLKMMKKMEKAKHMKEEFGDFMKWKMMKMQEIEEKNAPVFTYFDIRVRGEIARLMIAYGGLKIKERRVNITGDEWANLKPSMPYGQLPILNISGHVFAQSLAIQKFIAIKAGLYPKNYLAQLMVDQIANAREDLLIAESRFFLEQDPVKKAEYNATVQKAYPLYLGNFNRYISENPDKSGYVIGHKLTLADLIIFEGSQTVFQNQPEMLEQFPYIRALRAKVGAEKGIMEYIIKRGFYEI